MPTLTPIESLQGILCYDPLTGIFRWRIPQGLGGCNGKIGDIAGSLSHQGYWVIRIKRRMYRAHRLAWFYMTGEWPSKDIDHCNRIKTDNRWDNLRLATRAQNNANAKIRRDNSSGFRGVSFAAREGKWRARINRDKKEIHLGLFDTAEMAHEAYKLAANNVFGEFARVG